MISTEDSVWDAIAIEKYLDRADCKKIYDQLIAGPHEEELLCNLQDRAIISKDCSALNVVDILYEFKHERSVRMMLNFFKKSVSQFWCSHHADYVGWLQGYGLPKDISFLEDVAMKSLPSWYERNDEMQQFFRKCTWAIGEIDRRDHRTTTGLEVLHKMATIDPPIAAHWARKQINRTLGDRSPYIDEDPYELPEIDYDWPYPDTSNQS